MDERLTWEKHGKHMICSKVSAGIGAIKRIRPFVPPATLKLIYNAVVQPSLANYGMAVKDSLQKFQNLMMFNRLICSKVWVGKI